MKQINIGIIGTGWCGGIRAETCATHPVVNNLHIAEIKPERLAEVAKASAAKTATTDYRELLKLDEIDAYIISATPETHHYPMARECLLAGKHVFLEKPIAIELHEADELIALARKNKLKFTIGYSQRFNPKFAYVKKALNDGTTEARDVVLDILPSPLLDPEPTLPPFGNTSLALYVGATLIGGAASFYLGSAVVWAIYKMP